AGHAAGEERYIKSERRVEIGAVDQAADDTVAGGPVVIDVIEHHPAVEPVLEPDPDAARAAADGLDQPPHRGKVEGFGAPGRERPGERLEVEGSHGRLLSLNDVQHTSADLNIVQEKSCGSVSARGIW